MIFFEIVNPEKVTLVTHKSAFESYGVLYTSDGLAMRNFDNFLDFLIISLGKARFFNKTGDYMLLLDSHVCYS
jgi:hypothetical protein